MHPGVSLLSNTIQRSRFVRLERGKSMTFESWRFHRKRLLMASHFVSDGSRPSRNRFYRAHVVVRDVQHHYQKLAVSKDTFLVLNTTFYCALLFRVTSSYEVARTHKPKITSDRNDRNHGRFPLTRVRPYTTRYLIRTSIYIDYAEILFGNFSDVLSNWNGKFSTKPIAGTQSTYRNRY